MSFSGVSCVVGFCTDLEDINCDGLEDLACHFHAHKLHPYVVIPWEL